MRRVVGRCFHNGTSAKKELKLKKSVTSQYEYCMEKAVADMLKMKDSLSYSILDKNSVVDSDQFFKSYLPQSNSDIPPMLLIDEPVYKYSKLKLLQTWNFNLDDGENNNPYVKHAPYVSHYSISTRPTSSATQPKSIALTIRIITINGPPDVFKKTSGLFEQGQLRR